MIKRTIVIESEAQLTLQQGQMSIARRQSSGGNDIKHSVPVEDIGVLVLESRSCLVSSALIAALTQAGAVIMHCDERHMPSALTLPLEGNTLQQERYQAQIHASVPLRKNIWMQLVKSKIYNQASVLSQLGMNSEPLLRWASEVKSGDSSNLEARAAAYYWPLLMRDENFRRERNASGANACFNYGYAILRAVVARALVAAGLLPTLGVHHHNRYNAYCLADDMMETFRPVVDLWIMKCSNEMGFQDELGKEWKAVLLKVPVLDVLMEGEKSPLMVAAARSAASLVKIFEGRERKVLLPEIFLDGS